MKFYYETACSVQGYYQQSSKVLVCKYLIKIQFLTIFADVDECSNEGNVACGDHVKCENVDGGFNCSCKEGYQPSTGKLQFKPNDGTSCQGTWYYKGLCVIIEIHLLRNPPVPIYLQLD